MEDIQIHGNDYTHLVLGSSYGDLSQPDCAKFSLVRLHIHRTNFLGSTQRVSQKDSNFHSEVPVFFLLDDVYLNQAISSLISRVDPMDRSSAESMKKLICTFVRKAAYQSLEFPNRTLLITARIWVTLFDGMSWKEACDDGVLIINEAPRKMKYRGGRRDVSAHSCAIYLEDFVQGVEIKKTICKHMFHGKCLSEWFSRNHTCPLCRFKL